MIYSKELENMSCVAKGVDHGPAPIPEEGKWVKAKEIKDISGLTHGIGWCARRYLRYRTVVERKIYRLLLAGNTPYRFRNQHPVKIRWLFYKHNLKKKRRDGTADLIDTANRISASPLF